MTAGEGAPATLRAQALLGGGRLALCSATTRPRSVGSRPLSAVPRARRSPGYRGRSRYSAAWLVSRAGTTGRRNCTRRASPSPRRPATTRPRDRAHFLGFAWWLRGDYVRAIAEGNVALAGFRAVGDAEGIAWSLISLGAVARYQGDDERAAALLEESLALSEGIGFREGVAWSAEQLGLLAAAAATRMRRAAAPQPGAARQLRDRWRMSSVLEDFAAVALAGGRAARATGLLGAAEALRNAIGTVVAPCEQAQHDQVVRGAGRARRRRVRRGLQQGQLAPFEDLPAAPEPSPPAGPAEHSQAARHPRPPSRTTPSRGRGASRITRDPAYPGARRGHRAPRRHPRHRRGLRLRQAARAAVPAGLVATPDQRAARRRAVARPVATAARQRAAHRAARGAPGPG